MGKKGGSSYHERQLTPEERALIAQQQRYLESIQPSIDMLVSRGTSLLDDVVNPDWSSIYTTTVKDVDKIRAEQAQLATGQLPQVFSDAKMNYFNRIYENTMGKNLASMAKNGVVDSSRFNTTVNDVQKNFAAQASQDYTKDLDTAKGLLDQKYQFAMSPLQIAKQANEASFANPAQYLSLAQGQNRSNTEAIQTQGQLNNGRGYVTQEGSGFFGGLMSGVGSYLACFIAGTKIKTADGFIDIEDMKPNMIVIAKEGIEKVIQLFRCGEMPTKRVRTESREARMTDTQTLFTRDGWKPLSELTVGDDILTDIGYEAILELEEAETESVYELAVTGSNTFYANGICAEGFDEEEINAIHSV